MNILDKNTIAFADYSGNRQYITQGNLSENAKAHIFIMDYAHRRRVKIWGEARVVDMAAYFLRLNGSLYVVLGALFVLRGALQGLGHTAVPTITGALELCCRVAAALVLGAQWGFDGLVWGNPLAWFAAIAALVPAYARAHRALADDVGSPEEVAAGETLPDVVAAAPVGGSVPTPDSAGA